MYRELSMLLKTSTVPPYWDNVPPYRASMHLLYPLHYQRLNGLGEVRYNDGI